MFRYVIFDILLPSRKFPLFRTRFAEFKTFFLSCTFLHLSFSDILQYPFSSKQDEQRHVAESFRKKDFLPILTLYHRRVPGDVTSRANSRGSYGNGAANTKPKSIRCTRQHIARGARWALVVPEVGDGRTERERERYTSVRKIHAMRERRIETGIYIRGTYLVMGQCASVTIRYCVRAHCSWLFFLRA